MKTQMVKNSVIVPVGSKGGFVLKGEVPPRPALDEYLIDRYREFVSGPARRDRQPRGRQGDPPAGGRAPRRATTRTWWSPRTRARRTSPTPPTASPRSTASGWATPSPRAAATATTTRRMGITARGAWECVQAPLPQPRAWTSRREPFTVAGIGDMSGDVFGNGVAAQPRRSSWWPRSTTGTSSSTRTPTRSELRRARAPVRAGRARPGGTTTRRCISEGGGIFDRSAKAIPLSPEARRLLDIEADERHAARR